MKGLGRIIGAELSEEIRACIIREIGRVIDLDQCLILLFGSFALGIATRSSDIDIAIHSFQGLSDEELVAVTERLNYYVDTLREIEVMDLEKADTEFLGSALKGAVVWHVGRGYIESWLKARRPLAS